MDFHIVLPSNGSPKVYKENKTSNFKIQLPERLDLHGHWQVALLEINYPNTCFNVQHGENWIRLYEDRRPAISNETIDEEEEEEVNLALNEDWHAHEHLENYWREVTCIEVKPGFYPSAEALELSIGNLGSSFLKMDPNGTWSFKRLVHEDTTGDLCLFYAPRLALQLGLPTNGPFGKKGEVKPIRETDIKLGLPTQMFVYMDIVSEQIVGHMRAPLLRSLPTNMDGKFGTTTTYRFDTPVYQDLKTKSFDTIEVHIRTCTGDFMPFHHGTATLLCHFRKLEKRD